MKTLLGFFALFFFFTGAQAEQIEGVEPYLDFDPHYIVPRENIENNRLFVRPENTQYEILSDGQEREFELALSLLEETLNSEEFKTKVLSYRRSDGKRLFQKNFLWNQTQRRLSNEDVYNILMRGDEHSIPGTEGEMNLNSWIKKCSWWERAGVWCRKVIGSTNPSSSKWIKINYKFYSRYHAPEMVNNLVHEWIHLLGFLHGSENMREEVPYVVGRIAQDVAEQILAKKDLY